jgi:hypothetical protein
MIERTTRRMRPRKLQLWALGAALLFAMGVPLSASAQTVTNGDFDICDYCGNLTGNVLRLQGRANFGTNSGTFVLINANNDAQDVDRDGWTSGVHFLDLFISNVEDFQNVADPARIIESANFILGDALNPLMNGFQNVVSVSVNIPDGTPAGLYRGSVQVRDSLILPGRNANGEQIRIDNFIIEVEVLPTAAFELVRADTNLRADSLRIAGRAGQTVRGVLRVANVGNVPLSNMRLESTDLVATSGTGLRIRRERISFSPEQLTTIALADTQRVVVTVRIPSGLLAGDYRGDLIMQGDSVTARRIPFTVTVQTPGDLVFETNPVIGRAGDQAVVIFNADPGTRWEMRIFDMMGLAAYASEGTVFAGSVGTPGPLDDTPGDQAVRVTWPLQNGRGENVAGGMYYVVVNAVQDGSDRQLRGKLMVIR